MALGLNLLGLGFLGNLCAEGGFARLWLGYIGLGKVRCSPEVPGCNTAVGSPFLAVSEKYFGRWKFLEPIRQRKAASDTVVGHREDVFTSQLEDQHHLDSPQADAADLGEPVDDFQISEAKYFFLRGHGAIKRLSCKVLKRGSLVARKPSRTEIDVRNIE